MLNCISCVTPKKEKLPQLNYMFQLLMLDLNLLAIISNKFNQFKKLSEEKGANLFPGH